MISYRYINIALVLIATTGSFAPTSIASEAKEVSTRFLSAQTEGVRAALLVESAHRSPRVLGAGRETFGKCETTSSP
jgi:hypothetical protein